LANDAMENLFLVDAMDRHMELRTTKQWYSYFHTNP